MDDPEDPDNTGVRVENSEARGGLEQNLRERLTEVVRLLKLADDEGKRADLAAPRLLDKYRAPFTGAMINFGEALADFLDANGASKTLLDFPAFAEQLAPLLEIFRSVPVLRRAQDWGRTSADADEVQRAVLLTNPSGFDLPTSVLGDFSQTATISRAFRTRTAALAELSREEVLKRAATSSGPIRMLRLACGTDVDMGPLLGDPVCVARTSLTCVDDNVAALRRVRKRIETRLAHKPRFLLADPLTLGTNPNRPRGKFDIVIALDLFDALTALQSSQVLRDCSTFLAPGGVLLTGGYLPEVPRHEAAFTAGLVGVHILYLEESGWGDLLREAGFDLENTRLERMAPSTLLVAASRGQPEDS